MKAGRERVTAAAVGATLRKLRVQARMSQDTLARSAGLVTSSYGRIERGQICPRVLTLVLLADALEVPVAQLLHDVPAPGTPATPSDNRDRP